VLESGSLGPYVPAVAGQALELRPEPAA
jgi:hypothetical protein